MEDPKYHIALPDKVIKKLHLKSGEEMNLTINDAGLTLDKEPENLPDGWNVSLWWTIVPAIISGLIFWFFYKIKGFKSIPLSGDKSIAAATILLGVIFGSILFGIFLVKSRRSNRNTVYRNIYWRNFLPIICACTLILCVALIGVFWILGTCFVGTSFNLLSGAIIVGVFEAVVNYVMIKLATSITPTVLVDLIEIIIVTGILISMVTNSNKRWWKHNLSYLGGNRAIDSWQFNITVLFTALMLLVVIDYLFVYLQSIQKPNKNTISLRILLSALAIAVGCIGIFHNNRNVPWLHFVHTFFGWSLVVILILLIGGIKWLWPESSKNFILISYSVGLLLIICSALFWFTNLLGLTAFELISFASAFVWILMLIQYILEYINSSSIQFKVKITKE